MSDWQVPSVTDTLESRVVCSDIVYAPRDGVLYPTGGSASATDTVLADALCSELWKAS